ncbi:MAG TPA: histidinol dehydrogenase, partial [Solirubrobacterales bacterium]|nr:histidinol dehydrogenase [Solirubrobacterales bacterium]
MKVKRFEWQGPGTAFDVRLWDFDAWPNVEADVREILRGYHVSKDQDAYLLELTARFDATEVEPQSLLVAPEERVGALGRIDDQLRRSMELAAENIRAVAAAQVDSTPQVIDLPQGQSVTIREVPVRSAGIYAPGGRAAYPSSVLMCAIPARVAGVEFIALATPPGPDGRVNP